ncbi:30S ribosomal protein [Dirofilaria immitis]
MLTTRSKLKLRGLNGRMNEFYKLMMMMMMMMTHSLSVTRRMGQISEIVLCHYMPFLARIVRARCKRRACLFLLIWIELLESLNSIM